MKSSTDCFVSAALHGYALLAMTDFDVGFAYLKIKDKNKKANHRCDWLFKINMAATYSPALLCSTIGHGGLNFSVRNGKR